MSCGNQFMEHHCSYDCAKDEIEELRATVKRLQEAHLPGNWEQEACRQSMQNDKLRNALSEAVRLGKMVDGAKDQSWKNAMRNIEMLLKLNI